MKALLIRVAALAVAFLAVDLLMESVSLSGGFFGILGLAAVYGVASGTIGTLLRMLSLPLIVLTVGLFEFVINALMLLLTEWLTDWIRIDGFVSALLAAVVLTLVSVIASAILGVVVRNGRR